MLSDSSSSPARKSPKPTQRSRNSSASSTCLRSRKRSTRTLRRAKRRLRKLAASASTTKSKQEAKPSISTNATVTRLRELGCTLKQDPKDMPLALKQRICNAEREIVALQRRRLAVQNAMIAAAMGRQKKAVVGLKNAVPVGRTRQTDSTDFGAVAKVRGSTVVPPKCTTVSGPHAANSTCRGVGSPTIGHSPVVQSGAAAATSSGPWVEPPTVQGPAPRVWLKPRVPPRPPVAPPGAWLGQPAPSQPSPLYAPRIPPRPPPPPPARRSLSTVPNYWPGPQVLPPPRRPHRLGETGLFCPEQAHRAAMAGAMPKNLSVGSAVLARPRWSPVVNKTVVQHVFPQDNDALNFEVKNLLCSGNYDRIPEIKWNDLRSHLRDMLEMDRVESPPSVFTAFYGEVDDEEDDESNEDVEEREQKGQVDENEHAERDELQSSEEDGGKGEETTTDEESKGIGARTSLLSIPPASRDSVILASTAAAATVVSAARTGSPDAAELAAEVAASGDHDMLSVDWNEEEALFDLSPISDFGSEDGGGVHETTAQLPLPQQAPNDVTGDAEVAEVARDAGAQDLAQGAELQNTIGLTSASFSVKNGSQQPAATLRPADARGGTDYETESANDDEATATAPATAMDVGMGSPQPATGAVTTDVGGLLEQKRECLNDDKAATTASPRQGRKRKMRSVILTPSWREGAMAAVELMLKRRLEAASPGEEIELTLRQIKYSQESIKGSFRDGRTIRQMRRELAAGCKRIEQIPKIQAVIHDGCVYSPDNRRLWAFKHVGMPQETRIPVVVGAKTPLFFRKLTTPTFGRSMRRRAGTGGIY